MLSPAMRRPRVREVAPSVDPVARALRRVMRAGPVTTTLHRVPVQTLGLRGRGHVAHMARTRFGLASLTQKRRGVVLCHAGGGTRTPDTRIMIVALCRHFGS